MGHLPPTLLSALFPALYVGSIYLRKQSRLHFNPNPTYDDYRRRVRGPGERWRDDNAVIRARLYAVSLSTICSIAIVAWTIASRASASDQLWNIILDLLGFLKPSSLLAYVLVPILFAGPLLSRYLRGALPFQRSWSIQRNVFPKLLTLVGLRNFVIAPVTEELLFRSCILAIGRLSGQTNGAMIFLSPLWFGIAHLHHALEMYHQNGKTSQAFRNALVVCAIQLTYTTVFGWISAFLMVRTGSVLPCITSHVFCNLMGLPTPGADSENMPKYKGVIWGMHVVGVIGFIACIRWLD